MQSTVHAGATWAQNVVPVGLESKGNPCKYTACGTMNNAVFLPLAQEVVCLLLAFELSC